MPFYLRTGKRLPKRTTEIAIQFRRPPLEIFRRASQASVAPNLLVVNVQPDEGISLRFETKLPGTRMQIAPVMMNFRYGTTFGGEVPEAYETLLLDAMLGTQHSSPVTISSKRHGRSSGQCWTCGGAQKDEIANLRSWRVGTGRGRRADGAGRPPVAKPVKRPRASEEAPAPSAARVAGRAPGSGARRASRTRRGSRELVAFRAPAGRRRRLVQQDWRGHGARDVPGQRRHADAGARGDGRGCGADRSAGAAAEALQSLGDAGTVRGILISEGDSAAPPARVAGNTVALHGLKPAFFNNAVAALRLSSLPTLVWWRGRPDTLDGLAGLAERIVLDDDQGGLW